MSLPSQSNGLQLTKSETTRILMILALLVGSITAGYNFEKLFNVAYAALLNTCDIRTGFLQSANCADYAFRSVWWAGVPIGLVLVSGFIALYLWKVPLREGHAYSPVLHKVLMARMEVDPTDFRSMLLRRRRVVRDYAFGVFLAMIVSSLLLVSGPWVYHAGMPSMSTLPRTTISNAPAQTDSTQPICPGLSEPVGRTPECVLSD